MVGAPKRAPAFSASAADYRRSYRSRPISGFSGLRWNRNGKYFEQMH